MMLGLYIRAKLASPCRDSKGKGREIRRQKFDVRGSLIVYFAMSHMRNELHTRASAPCSTARITADDKNRIPRCD